MTDKILSFKLNLFLPSFKSLLKCEPQYFAIRNLEICLESHWIIVHFRYIVIKDSVLL